MNYIVFDLEATCDKNRTLKNEVIEIGAVKLNDKLEIVDTFDCFVKPILNPMLTDFCTELTSINQSDIDSADTFSIAINRFKKWIGEEDYLLCSWGYYDKKQIINDSNLHKLDYTWATKHVSLKHIFGDINEIKPCGTWKALKLLNLKFEGTQHRANDDAKNISRILIKCFDDFKPFLKY